MEREIIHINVADFAVAVERAMDSGIRQRPVIVAFPAARAVVYDMSEEAYQDGVRKNMPLHLARRRCPAALLLAPRPALYRRATRRLLQRAQRCTPLVEQGEGDGHLFLDVSGCRRLLGPAADIGRRLQREIRDDLGCPPVWTLASSRLVAKVASRLVKPVGEYIVPAGSEQRFLSALPISLLPGLGREEQLRLREFNLARIGDLARLSARELHLVCPGRATFLHRAAQGIDPTPVGRRRHTLARIVVDHDFPVPRHDDRHVRATVIALAGQAGRRLRRRGMGCCRLGVHILYADGRTVQRQAASPHPVLDDRGLARLALTALYRGWHRRVAIRALQVHCFRLIAPVRQLSLFSATPGDRTRQERLCRAVDAIHDRFGGASIVPACRLVPGEGAA